MNWTKNPPSYKQEGWYWVRIIPAGKGNHASHYRRLIVRVQLDDAGSVVVRPPVLTNTGDYVEWYGPLEPPK